MSDILYWFLDLSAKTSKFLEERISTIHLAIEKIRKRSDLDADTNKYFMVKDPKFAGFYLFPKIHKRLHDFPGRLVISNCGYYTENISSLFNRDLNRGCLVYKFSLRFSGSKFLINLRWQFRLRKVFSCT